MASYRTAAAVYAPQHLGFGSVGDFQNGANGATFAFMTPTYADICESRVMTDLFLPYPEQNDVSNVSGSVIDDLAAVIAGIGTVVANLTVSRALVSAVSGVGVVSASLADSRKLSTTVAGTSVITPNLKVSRALSTVVAGVGAVSGALTVSAGGVTRALAAVISGTSTVTAALSESRKLATSVVGTASISASLKLQDSLRTVISGASQVIGNLTIIGAPPITGISDALKHRRRMLRAQVGTVFNRRRRRW